MLYLDTSLLVATLTDEIKTADAQGWLAKQPLASLAISDWVVAELSAALSIKLRTGQITLPYRANALATFAQLTARSFEVWTISGPQFHAAAKYADQYTHGLRAGDALHLAISADHGATLCTLDRQLAQAGNALGVKTLLL